MPGEVKEKEDEDDVGGQSQGFDKVPTAALSHVPLSSVWMQFHRYKATGANANELMFFSPCSYECASNVRRTKFDRTEEEGK